MPSEFLRGHVATRGEIVMDDGGQRVSLFETLAGARFDTGRRFELQDAKNSVETVGTHVAESAATEIAPNAPDERQVRVVERTLRRRAEPEVPIETFGDGFGLLWAFDALRPVRTAGPVGDFAHRADGTVPNPFAEQASGLGGLVANGNLSGDAGFTRDFGEAARFIDGVGQRLLAEDVFALLHRRSGDGGMKMVRGADNDGVEIVLLVEQLAEVIVGGTAAILAGALLGGVIGVHDFLTRFAAGNSAGDSERMSQLNGLVGAEPVPAGVGAEQFADRIAEFMGVPLRVIGAGFIGIADGNALNVGLAQEAKHNAQALGSDADERNVDLVTEGNIPCTA